MDTTWLVNTLNTAGVPGALIIFVVGLVRRWWVIGSYYDELRLERDEWKRLALSGTSLAGRAIDLAQQAPKSGI